MAPRAIVVNAAQRQPAKLDRAGIEAKRGRAVFVVNPANGAPAHRFGGGRAGVNLCGRRPNNTSDFDTIGHAPALGFR